MLEEQARVVGVEGDAAMLEVVRRSACGLCGQTQGCGASMWGRWFGHHSSVFRVDNSLNARVGDEVVVGVDEQALLLSSLTVYGVPLALLLAGALLGSWLAPMGGDAWPLLGAGSGLAVGLLWLRSRATAQDRYARYRPVLLRQADAQSQIKFCHRGQP